MSASPQQQFSMTGGPARPVRAAVWRGPRQLELTTVGLPSPGEHEVAVAVEACGICATNLRVWATSRRPGVPAAAPGFSGHEIVGRIAAVANRTSALRVGDLVCVEPVRAAACRVCSACEDGRAWFCQRRREIPVWGFADAIVVASDSVAPLPADMATAGTLVEPLACAVHAIRQSWTAQPENGGLDGRRIAILGAGATGLLLVVAARHLGAGSVTVLARYDHQAVLAADLGADEVVRSDDPQAREHLRSLRPQLVVEAVGARSGTFELALASVAPGGELAVLGLFDATQQIDARRAVLTELRLAFPVAYGSSRGLDDFQIALAILSQSHARLERLVTHSFELADVGAAFATAADKRTGAVRVIVQPSPGRAMTGGSR
jgi:2-desacetyl-2-hydroxyethyl bacteriochlorophyllide A dehydrogenase